MNSLKRNTILKYERVIKKINQNDIDYVVLRGYEGFPTEIKYGGDVDIYIHVDDYEKSIADIFERKFEHATRTPIDRARNFKNLIIDVQNPFTAAYKVISNPDIRQLIIKRLKSNKKPTDIAGSPAHEFVEVMFEEENLQINIQNHMAFRGYGSPDQKIKPKKRVMHPYIEQSIIKNRIQLDNIYIPSPPDNLLQLLLRITLEYPYKSSGVPDYYVKKMDALVEEIRSDSDLDAKFKKLLSVVFFDADEMVYKMVMGGEYRSIRHKLTKFHNY